MNKNGRDQNQQTFTDKYFDARKSRHFSGNKNSSDSAILEDQEETRSNQPKVPKFPSPKIPARSPIKNIDLASRTRSYTNTPDNDDSSSSLLTHYTPTKGCTTRKKVNFEDNFDSDDQRVTDTFSCEVENSSISSKKNAKLARYYKKVFFCGCK